jgi:hypothetical protein
MRDVKALTVDAARAGLSCPTVTVNSDGAATVRFTSLHANAPVTGGTTLVRTSSTGAAAVPVAAGKSTLRVCAGGAGGGAGAGGAPSGSSGSGSLAATGAGMTLPLAGLALLVVAGCVRRGRRGLGERAGSR